MIKIAICDDEQFYQEKIFEITEEYFRDNDIEYEILIFYSAEELFDNMEILASIQIILMDINMNGLDGLTAAQRIRKINPNIFITFITSFMEYSLEGYKVNAFRYILKDSLSTALQECLHAILGKMKVQTETLELGVHGRKIKILTDHIIYIESQRHKLYVHTYDSQTMKENTDVYSFYKKLDEIQDMLNKEHFLRINKSYIVNLKYIRKVVNYETELETNQRIGITRDRFSEIKRQYLIYKGKE